MSGLHPLGSSPSSRSSTTRGTRWPLLGGEPASPRSPSPVAALRRGEADPTRGLPLLPREGLDGRIHGCRSRGGDRGQLPPVKQCLGASSTSSGGCSPHGDGREGSCNGNGREGHNTCKETQPLAARVLHRRGRAWGAAEPRSCGGACGLPRVGHGRGRSLRWPWGLADRTWYLAQTVRGGEARLRHRANPASP